MNPSSPPLCRWLSGPAAAISQPSFAWGSWQSAAVPEASLLPQPHTAAESLCSLLATSEPTEVLVPGGNILSVRPDHDNAKRHPVWLFWASLPSELGIQCQGDMPRRIDIMPVPPVGSPESGGWLQSLRANLFLSP